MHSNPVASVVAAVVASACLAACTGAGDGVSDQEATRGGTLYYLTRSLPSTWTRSGSTSVVTSRT